MALIQKITLCVYECRPYSIKNARTGQDYSGFTVKAFKEDGSTIMFSTKDKMAEYDLGSFDPVHAVTLTLFGKEFQGEQKWSTEKPQPRQQ